MQLCRLKDLQELLGHKISTMTMRYAHLLQKHKKKAVNLFSLSQRHDRQPPEGGYLLPPIGGTGCPFRTNSPSHWIMVLVIGVKIAEEIVVSIAVVLYQARTLLHPQMVMLR